jgi:hypothetical protein
MGVASMLESFHKARSSYAIFGYGSLVGLVCGFALGMLVVKGSGKDEEQPKVVTSAEQQAAQTKALKIATDPALWTDLPIEWKRLKPFSEAGKAPLTFSTPTAQYDYGAVSHPIPADLVGKALILRVDIADVKHAVGVSLVDPQGQPLRSEEQGLSDKDKKRSIFFRVTAESLPAALLIRNYGDTSGAPGAITVEHVFYTKESALTPAQLQALSQVGVNKNSN